MKLLLKILFFLLTIFYTNISEAKVVVFDVVVSEITPTVNEVKVKHEPREISENDFGISSPGSSTTISYFNVPNKERVLKVVKS